MKSLIYSIWKGPFTSLIGLFLLALAVRGFYMGTLTVLWDGVVLVSAGLALMVTPDKKIRDFVSKFFNALLDKFKGDGPGVGPLVPLLALAILMSSCGFVKKVTREKEKSHAKVDSVAKTSTTTLEKTTTKVTEKIDTAVKVKGSTVKGSTPIKNILTKPFVVEDQNAKATARVDSLGNLTLVLESKDREAHLYYNRTTETEKNKSTNQDSEVRKRTETTTKSKSVDKDVKWRGSTALIIIPLLLILAAITLIRRYGSRIFGG